MNREWVLNNGALAPEVRGVVDEGVGEGSISGFNEVTSSSGFTFSLGVKILETSELEQLFSDWGSNQTSSSGGGNQSNLD